MCPGEPNYANCSLCPAKILAKHEDKMALDDHAQSKKRLSRIENMRQTKAISVFMVTKSSHDNVTVAFVKLFNQGQQ